VNIPEAVTSFAESFTRILLSFGFVLCLVGLLLGNQNISGWGILFMIVAIMGELVSSLIKYLKNRQEDKIW
jgi:uncharacterized membrane protein YiaA